MIGTMVMQPDQPKVYHYGFLSSRTSGALKQYLACNKVSEEQQDVLRHACTLVSEIVQAQAMFCGPKAQFAPSEGMLDAYGCALDVISEHPGDFTVNGNSDFSVLIESVRATLASLSSGGTAQQADVQKCRMFFRRLAELMLAQLSTPIDKVR